ncbi:MAG: hypothetical protein J6A04_01285 [Clostridia bacterium]|nr:hypothetical protein [Clostridia bacterium]
MKQWTKRLIYKVVAAVLTAAVGLVLCGIAALLSWIFRLIPKTTKSLDPYSVVITILACFIISLLGELVGWIWKKIRKNRKPRRRKDEEDDEDEDE